MDGGPRRMCFSVKWWWCALRLLHTDHIQACVAWDEPVMQEKLFFIWLYPNECNSVFSNWRQQDAPVFLPLPGIWHAPPAKRRPRPPQSAQRGWTQDTKSLMSHTYPGDISRPGAKWQHACTHFESVCVPSCRDKHTHIVKCFLKELRGNSIVKQAILHSLQLVSFASMFISNFLL